MPRYKPAVVRVSQNQVQYWSTKSGQWMTATPAQIQAIMIATQAGLSGQALFELSDALKMLEG